MSSSPARVFLTVIFCHAKENEISSHTDNSFTAITQNLGHVPCKLGRVIYPTFYFVMRRFIFYRVRGNIWKWINMCTWNDRKHIWSKHFKWKFERKKVENDRQRKRCYKTRWDDSILFFIHPFLITTIIKVSHGQSQLTLIACSRSGWYTV